MPGSVQRAPRIPSGRKCVVAHCQKLSVAHDLCATHHKRRQRHGDVLETRAADWGAREKHPLYRVWNNLMRNHRVETCERWQDLWNFVADLDGARPSDRHRIKRIDENGRYEPENVYWREPVIKKGVEARKAACERARKWRQANLRNAVAGEMHRRYGISLDKYEAMLAEQHGKCAVCGNEETRIDHRNKQVSRLAVDHDHATGKIRGLLCHAHNNALGHFGDDPATLAAALIYLAKHAPDRNAVLAAAIMQLNAARVVSAPGLAMTLPDLITKRTA